MMRISLVRLFFAALRTLFTVDVGRSDAIQAYIPEQGTTACTSLEYCDGTNVSANQIMMIRDHTDSPLPSLPVKNTKGIHQHPPSWVPVSIYSPSCTV